MIINSQNLSTLYVGFQAAYAQAFAQFGAESQYKQVAMTVQSTTREEDYGWLKKLTRFREWIGDRVVQSISVEGYKIKNKSYENTVDVDRDDIADDLLGAYGPMFGQLAQDTAELPDELVFGLLAAGFGTACYDGQFFFDTDHPVIGANGAVITVSNSGGGAGAPWMLLDTTKVVKPLIFQLREKFKLVKKDQPTDDNVFDRKKFVYGVDGRCNVGFGPWQLAYGSKQTLDAAAFNTAYASMAGQKGDNGRPLGVRPKLLVVPPTLRATALEVVKAERNAAGATNINRDVVDVLVCPWLA